MDQLEKETIYNALLQWRNHIQTGNITISTQDAINMGQSQLCKPLNQDQIEYCNYLENLANKYMFQPGK